MKSMAARETRWSGTVEPEEVGEHGPMHLAHPFSTTYDLPFHYGLVINLSYLVKAPVPQYS